MEEMQIGKGITIIIPALNEEATISDIIAQCRKIEKDILVVDGHSSDQTASIAKAMGVTVIFDHQKGKGEAIRSAIPHIRGDIAVFVDADGSTRPARYSEAGKSHFEGRSGPCVRLQASGRIK